MRKRFLSLVIAICMLAAMLPTFAVSASALEVGESRSYYFYSGHSTTTGISNLSVDAAKEYDTANERYWKFKAIKGGTAAGSQLKNNRLNGYTKAVGNYIALEIEVPEDGTYKTEYLYCKLWDSTNSESCGSKGDVYILPEGTDLRSLTNALDAEKKIASVDYSPKRDGSGAGVVRAPVVNVELKKGDNILLFVVTDTGDNANSSTANYNYYTYPNSLTLTLTEKAPTEDEELKTAFTVTETPDYNYVEPTAIGIMTDGMTIDAEPDANGGYNLTAPDTNSTDKPFLYWVLGLKGNKRIVSFDKTIKNYVPAEEGRNYLIAVYEGDVDTEKVEYYNQNGQLIPEATENETVSMPGYGSTNKWVKYGDTNIYVADYKKTEAQRDEVTVTAAGGTVNGGTEAKVAFGTVVTCTADATDEDGNEFKCWTKSNIYGATDEAPEIVSIDSTYKFNAWETCTVTAVYKKHTPISKAMKIIIDDFTVGSETGVMAEFIGFDSDDVNVVEKGIMFGDKKIAMTTVGNQFTVFSDKTGIYKGYAIVEDDEGGYTLITDGQYEKK